MWNASVGTVQRFPRRIRAYVGAIYADSDEIII